MFDYVEVEEHELLSLAQNGDYDAFEQLHDRLQPPITRFVNRLVGGPGQEAEDIVQDTLISLYVNMKKIDPVENLRPYVFRIARNRCYDILRRQGRYEQLSLDDEVVNIRVSFDVADRSSNQPEDVVHWLLLHLEVQEAMENLPELQRQALILYSEEHMSYAEIAEIMNTSIGTIKSRLFHAKKGLRRLLKPETLAAIKGDVLIIEREQTIEPEQTPEIRQTPETYEASEALIEEEEDIMNEYHANAAIVAEHQEQCLREAERGRIVAENRLSANGNILKPVSSAIGNLLISAGEKLKSQTEDTEDIPNMAIRRA